MNFYSKIAHFLSAVGVFMKKSVIFHARRPCDAKSAPPRLRSLPTSNAKTARTVQTPQDGINKPEHTESKPPVQIKKQVNTVVSICRSFFGGDEGARTLDLTDVNRTL